MSTINKTNVVNGNTILANDILNVINALDGTAGNSIVITADLKQGTTNTTDNVTSHAEGDTTTATGTYSHAEGLSTRATGDYSHAEGTFTRATGYGSHTEGIYTTASGQYSHAEGYTTQAIGNYSHAEGNSTQAIVESAHAEGNLTIAGALGYDCRTTIVAGVFSLTGSYGNVTSLFPNGTPIVFINTDVYGTQYVDSASFTGGATQITLQDTSVSSSDNRFEVTIPGTPTPSGADIPLGAYSHAEGYLAYTYGEYSHAEGTDTQAIGSNSHAEGVSTQAIGVFSHTEGQGTQTIGEYSHAEGAFTIAIGAGSHAEGLGTIASGSYQHVSGKYNTQKEATSLFIVGNGTGDESRADAFKVTHSSSIVVPLIKNAPTWTGSVGEMVPVDASGNYYLYMWVGAAGWRRATFTL
jgi:hypothetical protein